MRKLFTFLFVVCTFTTTTFAQRVCATMEHLAMQQQQDPTLQQRMQAIEQHTHHTTNQMRQGSNTRVAGVITIPVVVHILYNTSNPQENISDAQIQSQIDVLNEDFRKLNADVSGVPDFFAPLAADIEIEFVMATVDPDGNPTNGITRKGSSRSSWGTSDAMKRSSQGGVDPWDASRYLNMWVCNIGGGILGYAQFPGGSLATDGVVMSPQFFGSSDKGTGFYLSAPFDKGRTTTHEVGHWLNLRHIWGDANCGNDFVADTPTQQTSNGGCPSFPNATCGNTSDMFMNYMDYVDDACMFMFSEGQKVRMRATFEAGGGREGFAEGGGSDPDPDPDPQPGPNYCASQGNNASYEWIETVSVGDFSNTTGGNEGYADLTATEVELRKGASTTVSLTPGFRDQSYNEYWKIWIDYNKDGDFEDAGELVYDAGSLSSTTVTGTFTVATAAETGTTRMRITMKYNGEPTACETFEYGEVEDYTVNILEGANTPTPTPTPTYCDSKGNSVRDEWIQRVQIGSIDNNSGANGGYGDFTSSATTVSRGSNYTITITPAWSGTVYSEGYTVWVDWNQDGDFTDAGEEVYSRASTNSSIISGSFSVPTAALEGATRMRVSMKYNGNPTACETFSFGEVEDYTLNVSASRIQQVASEARLEVFPNPAVHFTKVRLTEQTGAVTLRIVNISGALVYENTLQSNEEAYVDTKALDNGLYIISLQGEDGLSLQKKLIINR